MIIDRRKRLASLITRPMTRAEILEAARANGVYSASSCKLKSAVSNDLRELKKCGRIWLDEARWYPVPWEAEEAIRDDELLAVLDALGVEAPRDADRLTLARTLRSHLAKAGDACE